MHAPLVVLEGHTDDHGLVPEVDPCDGIERVEAGLRALGVHRRHRLHLPLVEHRVAGLDHLLHAK